MILKPLGKTDRFPDMSGNYFDSLWWLKVELAFLTKTRLQMFALTFGKETSYNFLEKFLKEKIKMWMYPQRRATLQYIIHMKKKFMLST